MSTEELIRLVFIPLIFGVMVGTVIPRLMAVVMWFISRVHWAIRYDVAWRVRRIIRWWQARDERAYAQRDDPVQSFYDWKRQKK